MRKNKLSFLFESKTDPSKAGIELKMLRDKDDKVVFVGSLRQVKRRLKKMFKISFPNGVTNPNTIIQAFNDYQLWPSFAKASAGLRESAQIGYTIVDAHNTPLAMNTSNLEKLKEKLKDIPKAPGVYQFLNKDAEVIYVGKAKDLRNRVGQYLGGKDERPQLPYLMAEAADVTYTVVNNELESLFLENTLIKQYLPKYNIQLRDDKNYAFITIDFNCEIPKIGYARKVDKASKNVKYFGPYSAAYKIRNTLNLMRRIFPYCAADKVSSRPCFYYYLHRCPGVCIGKISLEEYNQHLDRICQFLSGNTGKIKKDLQADMVIAASNKQFEKAARLRDQLQALQLLDEKQIAIMPKAVSWDVVSVAFDQGYACINLFKVREGKLFDKENFVYDVSRHTQEFSGSVLQTFLEQYYMDTSSLPQELFLDYEIEDKQSLAELIKSRTSKKINISTPKRGKAHELIKLGQTNASEHLKNWLKNTAEHLDKMQNALKELREVLQLPNFPERIECYDISNIQGTNPVGSMVVLKNGMPAKSEYRKFKIKTKSTPDDFAMMREMLTRRFSRLPVGAGFSRPQSVDGRASAAPTPDKTAWPTPDLIVIDGGKGQLSAALEVLQKFQITNSPSALSSGSKDKLQIPVIGLAKKIEEIFIPDKKDPILLPYDSPVLQMLQRLRDEAHRFGITFHRDLRSKQAVKSALDDIPGIGPKTKKLLKEKFGTVANIRKASMEELSAVVGTRIAQSIQQVL